MTFSFNDGGRSAAGYAGRAGDCVTRAIAIATQRPYQEVYDAINALAAGERPGRGGRKRSSARNGVHPATTRRYMESIGWTWTPTMAIGAGCRTHLRADELPAGRLVVQVTRHSVAVIDGVIHDLFDPSRNGTRCVYGYFSNPAASASLTSPIEDDDDAETLFENHYECPGTYTTPHEPYEWTDEWPAMCNDRCPICNAEIEPYESVEVEAA